MAARKTKPPKGIRKLGDGRYQLDMTDSRGKRHRPKCETLDEATTLKAQIEGQKATGQFIATSTTTTFGQLLDLFLDSHKGMVSLERHKTIKGMAGTLRPFFGERRLSDFENERMRFVQEWFDASPLTPGYLLDLRRVFKWAFALAAKEDIIGWPTPMEKFGIQVKRYRQHHDGEDDIELEDKVLQLHEMVALLHATRRVDREQYIVAHMRRVMVLLGLLTGMRPQAYCGLYWDCVDFDGRLIRLRRKCLNNGKIVWGSKTGRGGYRAIPMSPILHAVLLEWRDYLAGLGLPTTGAVPVLVTGGGRRVHVKSVVSGGYTRKKKSVAGHWARTAYKADLVDRETGALTHTAYCLRHTAANMWRAIGIDLEDLRYLMSHEKIDTTSGHYLHEAPHLAVLRREVAELGLEKTREGLIDGLGIVLAQRWREAGLKIPCSLPRSASLPEQARLPNYHDEGKVIDMTPAAVTMDAPASPVIRTHADLRAWQDQEIRRLRARGATKQQICDKLRVSELTVNNVLRSAYNLLDLKALPKSERAGIRARCREHYESGRHKTIREIALAEGVRAGIVMQWAREDGWTPPKEHTPYKLGQHDALIRQRLAEGKGLNAIARELGALGTKVTGQGIKHFARRHGLLDDPATVASAKAAKNARVSAYLGEGKPLHWIARVEKISTKTLSKLYQQRKASRQFPAEAGTDLARDAAA